MALKDQFSNPVYSRDLLGVQLSRIRPNEVTYPTNLSTNIL